MEILLPRFSQEVASWCAENAQGLGRSWLKDGSKPRSTYLSSYREAAISAAAPALWDALLVYDSGSGHVTVTSQHIDLSLCHTTATVASQWTPVVYTALCARELRVGQHRHHTLNNLVARSFRFSRSSRHEWANRITLDGRETTRWRLTGSMAAMARFMQRDWMVTFRSTWLVDLAGEWDAWSKAVRLGCGNGYCPVLQLCHWLWRVRWRHPSTRFSKRRRWCWRWQVFYLLIICVVL